MTTDPTLPQIVARLRAARVRAAETAERRGGTDVLYRTAVELGCLQAVIDILINELAGDET